MSTRTILQSAWEKYLKPFDVSWPDPSQEPGLFLLYEKITEPVSQDELTEHYLRLGLNYNKQLRHLAGSKGWHLAGGNKRTNLYPYDKDMKHNQLMLVSVTSPNPIWLSKTRLKRTGFLGAASWEEVLRAFSGRGCAVCGTKTQHYDKGHLDPLKPAQLGNLVPMCSSCNNYAASHDIAYTMQDLIARPIRFTP